MKLSVSSLLATLAISCLLDITETLVAANQPRFLSARCPQQLGEKRALDKMHLPRLRREN